MTDRELLELAAKAAGYTVHIWGLHGEENVARMDVTPSARWNPLTDDGDALRLAVRLNLSIGINCEYCGAVEIEHGFDTSGTARYYLCQDAPEGCDDYAATRRAIVRAAAELSGA